MWCNLLDLNGTDSPFSILQGTLWPTYWTQIGPRFLGTLGDLPVTLVIDTGFEGVMFFANRLPDGLKNLPEPASSPSLVHESDCARGVRGVTNRSLVGPPRGSMQAALDVLPVQDYLKY